MFKARATPVAPPPFSCTNRMLRAVGRNQEAALAALFRLSQYGRRRLDSLPSGWHYRLPLQTFYTTDLKPLPASLAAPWHCSLPFSTRANIKTQIHHLVERLRQKLAHASHRGGMVGGGADQLQDAAANAEHQAA